ncbi:MAG TPA: hypothetical protein VM012_15610 [Flavitalea sp.]|nr:hypothetical protein [Flavitalea sp.]
MRKRPSLLFVLVICSVISFAQEKKEHSDRSLYLRFNFLGMVDPFDFNFTMGVERLFTKHASLALDLGWIFHSEYFSQSKRANGILVRPSIRLYPRENGRGFVEMELHYKSVMYKIEDWVGRDCVNNVPAYDEFTIFRIRKQSYGFHLRGGVKGALDQEKRFWLELSSGIGLRWKTQGFFREGNSCYNRSGGIFLDPNVNSVAPAFLMNLKLLYRIH